MRRWYNLVVLDVHLRVRVDIDIPGPLHHTLQNGHQALQPLQPHGLLLILSGSQLQRPSPTGQLGQVVDQSLEYIGCR